MCPVCTLLRPFHSQSHFFFPLTVPEWREAPQRSRTWISFGLTLWKGQRRAPWNGSEAFTSLSQGPQLLHQPWNGRGWKHSRDTLTRIRKVPLSCDLILSLIGLNVCSKACTATVWAKSWCLREKLLPFPSPPSNWITHKSQGLSRCSYNSYSLNMGYVFLKKETRTRQFTRFDLLTMIQIT